MANQKQANKPSVTITLGAYDVEQKKKLVLMATNPEASYSDVLGYMENEIVQSKRMTEFSYTIHCFKHDGAFQLHRAIEEIFGVAQAIGDKQPSGGGEANLQTLDIILADGSRHKVPYGRVALDGCGEDAEIDIDYDSEGHTLTVYGKCQFRFSSLVDAIIDRTKELLRTDSIYKHQAIEITDINEPKLLSFENIKKDIMVLSDATEFALNPLYSRILHPDICIAKGIALKYGCLLEGPYGL